MRITHHASRITHHASRITHHTSHITHHTSHITHHTSHIQLLALFSLISLNAQAAPCESNFTSSGNFITGSTYKTFADLPNVSVDNAFEGALSDISKVSSWKILAQDKTKGMIQAVQAAQYEKGKVIPLNINIVPAGNGAKINMDYVTPVATASPEGAIKSQFCQTIAAASGFSGATSVAAIGNNNANVANAGTSSSPVSNQAAGMVLSEPQKKKLDVQLKPKVNDTQIKAMINEASPTIQKVLEMQACFYPHNSYGMYKNSGNDFWEIDNYHTAFKHHNMLECVNVQRIKDWKMIAKNAFQFSVLYVSEVSGESKQMSYEMQKQPDGVWLFNWNRPY